MLGSFALCILALPFQAAEQAPAPRAARAPSRRAEQALERRELGRRVRAMERAWAQEHEPGRRAAAVPEVERAVQAFFTGDMSAAARALDRARELLLDAPHAPGDSLALLCSPPLGEAGARELELRVRSLYPEELALPFRLRLSALGAEVELVLETLPFEGRLPLALPAGDVTLRLRLESASGPASERTLTVSRVERLAERLDAAERALAALGEEAPALERASARGLLSSLRAMARGEEPETDLPAARLFAELEATLAAAARGERRFDARSKGDSWLVQPSALGGSGTPLRIRVPAGLEPGRPAPLVIALHGAGGSENLFFDGYGDGLLARLCEERGWVLAAPRLSLLGGPSILALIELLCERLPIDRERVLLLGHSMGAAYGLRAASAAPERFLGFAALGGGNAPRDAASLKGLPVLAVAGERDFGRPGVEALHRALVAAGSEHARLVLLPGIEHLLVVQEALPEVLRWFAELERAR